MPNDSKVLSETVAWVSTV